CRRSRRRRRERQVPALQCATVGVAGRPSREVSRGYGHPMTTATAARPHAFDSAARSPAIDSAPPVAPNLARAPEVQQIHSNFLETLVFKGLSSPLALVLVVVQGRYLHASGRGSFVLVVLSVTILTRLLGQLGYAVTNRMQQRGVQ